MIDPTGPKPGRNRQPDPQEPHFEPGDGRADQPMYANEPDEPESGDAGGGNPAGGFGGWDLPAGARPGQSWRDRPAGAPDAGGPGGQGAAGQWSDGRGGSAAEMPAGQDLSRQGRPGGAAGGGQQRAQQQRPDDGELDQDRVSGRHEPAAGVAGLQAALETAEAKAKEAQEQYLRALAEMENVRRRAQEDVSKAHKFAIESFAESLLPVRDSLEMALTVEVPSVESLREGVEATLRQLTQAFDRNRLVLIDPLHQKFDPHQHQAIAMVPSREVAPNHVVSVLQKGYMINDRILRPALVTVSQSA